MADSENLLRIERFSPFESDVTYLADPLRSLVQQPLNIGLCVILETDSSSVNLKTDSFPSVSAQERNNCAAERGPDGLIFRDRPQYFRDSGPSPVGVIHELEAYPVHLMSKIKG